MAESLAPPRWILYLHVGRVSNLPTVWTNCLTGIMLAGEGTDSLEVLSLLAALSLFYTGGMFLNDAFDSEFDRVVRPERPVPSGLISVREVYLAGFGQLILAEGMLALPALRRAESPNLEVLVWGFFLALLIIYYNYRHKTDPLSPLVMALCRAVVYFTSAAMATSALAPRVLGGAAALTSFVVGLTCIAKQENLSRVKSLWPLLFLFAPVVHGFVRLGLLNSRSLFVFLFLGWSIYAISHLFRQKRRIPQTVIRLIAGISFLDAMLIAGVPGAAFWPWVALAGGLVTLWLQRQILGT